MGIEGGRGGRRERGGKGGREEEGARAGGRLAWNRVPVAVEARSSRA